MEDNRNDRDEELKRQIIDKIHDTLQELGIEVQCSSVLTPREQLTQADVLLDTMHFLRDYDENVKVLNKYWLEKKWKQKFEKVLGIDREGK